MLALFYRLRGQSVCLLWLFFQSSQIFRTLDRAMALAVVVGFPPRKPRFDLGLFRVGLLVERVAVR